MPHDSHDDPAHHRGHAHGHVTVDTDRRRLTAALVLILAFMTVEVVVGIAASSAALLADAAHMLVDAVALGLAAVALQLAQRPASGALTFGLRRAEVLSAMANGLTLVVLAGLIVYESVKRLVDPPDVAGASVLIVAAIGALVNLVALWLLAAANRENLNIEGGYQHILMDLVASLAVIIAGAIVLTTGADRADAIAALAVAALMLRSAWTLVRAASHILLEAAPHGLDPDAIGEALVAIPGVTEVHDLHVWQVTSGFPAMSAHVLVGREDDCHERRRAIEAMLIDRFDLHHTTLQVDHAPRRLHPIGRSTGDR
jgi:cobalt-zinc-cadmium efflux system protein